LERVPAPDQGVGVVLDAAHRGWEIVGDHKKAHRIQLFVVVPRLKERGESYLKKYVAEFIAAFFLVFAGTAAIVADQQLAVVLVRDSFGLLGVALAHGLALGVAIAAIGGISGGHANPAVSIAFYIARRLSAKDTAWYIVAQLLGGLFAALLVARVFTPEAVEATGSGVPALGPGTNLLQGGLIEVVLTFMLGFVIWGVAVNPKGAKIIAPLAIGLTFTFGILAGGPFTGAAMNPARWFGPAVVSGQFANWPVWVLGPIVGALLASTVYELFFLEPEAPEEVELEDLAPRAPEVMPGGERSEEALVITESETTTTTPASPPDSET
jgi:MIP family channel proteins